MRRTTNLIPKLHVRKDDTVKVLSGNSKGKTGRIIEVFPEDRKVIVEGVNLVKKHTKPSAKNTEGGIVSQEARIHVSKLMIVEPQSGLPSRVSRAKDANGATIRVTKRSGEILKPTLKRK